ncbi:MAG: hypothetical protein H0X17_22470 [Deltaproteobacteria bacterium]|nr:hypothetical protein [Deltaproteobacteria bacterium]
MMAKLAPVPRTTTTPTPTTTTRDDALQAQLVAMQRREAGPARRLELWEPSAASTTQPAPPVVVLPVDEILAILLQPVDDRLGHRRGHDAKEQQLRTLFDALSPLAAWTLRRRLANPRSGDPLACFARLVVERRGRLLAYLDDTRRRAALRSAATATACAR